MGTWHRPGGWFRGGTQIYCSATGRPPLGGCSRTCSTSAAMDGRPPSPYRPVADCSLKQHKAAQGVPSPICKRNDQAPKMRSEVLNRVSWMRALRMCCGHGSLRVNAETLRQASGWGNEQNRHKTQSRRGGVRHCSCRRSDLGRAGAGGSGTRACHSGGVQLGGCADRAVVDFAPQLARSAAQKQATADPLVCRHDPAIPGVRSVFDLIQHWLPSRSRRLTAVVAGAGWCVT